MDPAAQYGWDYGEELLAAIVELLDTGNRLFFQAHTKKGTRPPKPIEIRRPWDPVPDKPKMATSEEIARFFGGVVKYTGPKSERPRTPFEAEVLDDQDLTAGQKKAVIAAYRARS